MNIAIGCDHRGIELKQSIISMLAAAGHKCRDCGAFSTDPVDYPDIARVVGEAVIQDKFDYGILICNTGIGMSMAANKIKGIRAALCYDEFTAYRARLHNDANIVALGTITDENTILQILAKFLHTEFEGGRHQKRLDKMAQMENQR